MSIPFPLSLAVEQGIEAVLRLDPETRARLHQINGKVITVQTTQPAVDISLSIVDGHVHVMGVLDAPADTTISGSLSALRSMTRGNDALYRGEVSIKGDIGTGQVLKDILCNVDPDWEEHLSTLMGDSAAHRLGSAGRQLSAWVERTRSSLRQNTSEYLQEESTMLAPNSLVKAFCTDVDELRAACDRLDARVARLENLSRNKHT